MEHYDFRQYNARLCVSIIFDRMREQVAGVFLDVQFLVLKEKRIIYLQRSPDPKILKLSQFSDCVHSTFPGE